MNIEQIKAKAPEGAQYYNSVMKTYYAIENCRVVMLDHGARCSSAFSIIDIKTMFDVFIDIREGAKQ